MGGGMGRGMGGGMGRGMGMGQSPMPQQAVPPASSGQELGALMNQMQMLTQQLSEISRRLENLEKKEG
jgi:hypothetical protein